MPYIGNQPAPTNVGSANITDNSIVNADVNASAAIDVSKLSGAAPLASPTFTGTATAPTVNASTALQIGGVAITATAAELNILDGVTSTAAELNILDGYTGAVADLNRTDVTTEGLSEASKVVTADSNGVVSFDNGTVEESTAITSSSNAATINLRDGNVFTHTLSENVTYTFSNPAASGRASAFILKVTQDSSARTITWPSSVDWAAATAPTITATNAGVDVFGFMTVDGGTTYYGFTLGQALG